MINRIIIGCLVVGLMSCGKTTTEFTTPSGYKYSKVSANGKKALPGEYVYLTLQIRGSDGAILQEIGEGPDMPAFQLPTEENPLVEPNPVIEMLVGASIGDSLIMVMPIDSLPNGKTNPKLAGLDYIEYVTCVIKINDAAGRDAEIAEMKKTAEEKRLKYESEAGETKLREPEIAAMTTQLLKDFNDGKLVLKTTPEGLRYTILSEGEGDLAKNGQRASVHYYGTLLDGTMFDNSYKRGQPYDFAIGVGSVIKGWDLGVPLLNKGATAALFIPSDLAYGVAGSPPSIPGNSELMFYVHLVDVY